MKNFDVLILDDLDEERTSKDGTTQNQIDVAKGVAAAAGTSTAVLTEDLIKDYIRDVFGYGNKPPSVVPPGVQAPCRKPQYCDVVGFCTCGPRTIDESKLAPKVFLR